jgi:hypothetical protein
MAMLDFDAVRKLGLALPDVADGTAYGAPALKLSGKVVACIHDMDSPCSYGIGCARLKTVDRSITEQGESG